MAGDDPKTPLGSKRAATLSDDRDRQPPKSRPFGVPIQPETTKKREDITGVHKDPIAEMQARARVTQQAAESTESTVLQFAGRLSAAENELKTIKTDVTTLGKTVRDRFDAQDSYLKPLAASAAALANAASGTLTAKHVEDQVQLQLGAAQQQDQLDAKKHTRERSTVTIKTVMQIIGALGTSAFVGHLLLKAAGC